MVRRRAPILVLALALLLLGSPRALAVDAPAWSEIKWPFPMDQWGTGRAFRCTAAECGVAAELYLRPKIGFCNCTTGVADDDDLDRVGDIEILGKSFAGLGAGAPVTVGWMKGRTRSYLVTGNAARFALGIAYADKCDVVVATVVVVSGRPANAEAAALAFLNGAPVLGWVKAQLGL